MENRTGRKNWVVKLGIILMISSGLFFAAGLLIPLMNLTARTKVISSSVSFILMEIVFWTGGGLVGKELYIKYKSRLNPKNWGKRTGK